MLAIDTSSTPRNTFTFRPPGHPFTVWFWLSLLTFTFNWFLSIAHCSAHWGVLWSLAVEEQFYLFYPWTLRRLAQPRRIVPVLIVVALSGIAYRGCVYWLNPDRFYFFIHFATFAAFDSLAIGALSYMAYQRLLPEFRKKTSYSFIVASMGAFLALWVFSKTSYYRPSDFVLTPFIFSMGCGLFLIGGCSIPQRWSRFIFPLAWIGELSYGLYLLHISVLYVLWSIIETRPNILGFGLYFMACLATAWVSRRLLETPANRWICRCFGVSRGPYKELTTNVREEGLMLGEAEPDS